MRFNLTLILLFANVITISILVFLGQSRNQSSLFDSNQRLILDSSFISNSTRLELLNANEEAIWSLQKTADARWEVITPVHWKANRFAVERLLSQLMSLRWDTRFSQKDLAEAGQQLSDYGLAKPTAQLRITTENNVRTLQVGATSEIGNRLYVLDPEGLDILVVQHELLSSLSLDMDAFFDHQILEIPPYEALSLQIDDRTAGNVRTRLARSAGLWSFEAPVIARANASAVDDLLTLLNSIQAENLHNNPLPETGLQSPRIRTSVEGLNRRIHLLFGNPVNPDQPNEAVYAKRDDYPAVFQVDGSVVERLRAVQESLREKQFLKRLDPEWSSLEILMDDRALTLQKLENGNWQLVYALSSGELAYISADRARVENLVATLHTLEAVRFASDAPSESDYGSFGLNAPQRIVNIRTQSGQRVRLRLGSIDADLRLVYADTDLNTSVYQVNTTILAELPLSPLQYRDRLLQSLPSSSTIQSFKLTDSSGKALLESSEKLPQPLENFVRTTRAERYVDIPFARPLRIDNQRNLPWEYTLEVSVLLPGSTDARIYRFLFTRRLGTKSQYAVWEEEGTVFNLSPEVIEFLASL